MSSSRSGEAWAGTRCPCRLADLRVRYSARGMDTANAVDTLLEDQAPVDTYLLQLWPAPPAPDRVLKQTSELAAYWHRTLGAGSSVPGGAEE